MTLPSIKYIIDEYWRDKMDKIQVLLSTYNGEKYLKEQIESILMQEEVEVSILIRDDGSCDRTVEIIENFAKENTNITYYKGTNLGPARSFLDLLNHSGEFHYFAFADQDDVWKPNKLISAIHKLQEVEENKPSLYLSALEVVDENLNPIEIKKVDGNFCFEGEIIKNFATGCTQVFNKSLRNIINSYTPNYLIMHDSWITRVCYAIGGNVIIDDKSYILYRQHEKNVLGYQDKGFQKLKRQFKIAFIDNIAMRVSIAQELKNGYEKKLTNQVKEIIENLISYPTNKQAKKWLLKNKNFRTNNAKMNGAIKICILLNKF